ncbi:hypothetical protein DV708_16510 [Aeromonas veronii]|nr:hypothetical protein DV708_16510 [Aeromonas veronii]
MVKMFRVFQLLLATQPVAPLWCQCQRLAPGLPTGSMSEGDTAGAGGSGSRHSGGASANGSRPGC